VKVWFTNRPRRTYRFVQIGYHYVGRRGGGHEKEKR
jgi:hypothetical protein